MPYLGTTLEVPAEEVAFHQHFHACELPTLAAAWGIPEREALRRAARAPRKARRTLEQFGVDALPDATIHCHFLRSPYGADRAWPYFESGQFTKEAFVAWVGGALARTGALPPDLPDAADPGTIHPVASIGTVCEARLIARLWGISPLEARRIQLSSRVGLPDDLWEAEADRARALFAADADRWCFAAEDGLYPAALAVLARERGVPLPELDRAVRRDLFLRGDDARRGWGHAVYNARMAAPAPERPFYHPEPLGREALEAIGWTSCEIAVIAWSRAEDAALNPQPGPSAKRYTPHALTEEAGFLTPLSAFRDFGEELATPEARQTFEADLYAALPVARARAEAGGFTWCHPADNGVAQEDVALLAERWGISFADADWRVGQWLFAEERLALWVELAAARGIAPP